MPGSNSLPAEMECLMGERRPGRAQNRDYVIGIDVGGTNFRIGMVNRRHQVTGFFKIPVQDVLGGSDPVKDLGDYLVSYREKYCAGKAVRAVVIGFPATIDKRRSVLLQAPNVKNMENLPVRELLEKQLGISVKIERDVCLTACYDIDKYHIPDDGILTAFYFGTGIGNAIFVNGKLLAGHNGVAGELGHIPADGDHTPCGCGNMGCIENLAGGKYLAVLEREIYPSTPIENMFAEHGQEPELLRFVDRMAIAAATEINILDPDYVLIGGGVTLMRDFPRGLLEKKIREHTRKPFPEQSLRLIFTQDEPEKSVIGAAIYADRGTES